MGNTGCLGIVRRFFLKFLQINNNIPYLLAAQKIIFRLKFSRASYLKSKHFELPPACGIEHRKTKLTEMHT